MSLESTEKLFLMALKIDAIFEGKLTCASKNDKFWPEYSKVSKFGLWWDPYAQSRKCINLKFTGELCVMTIKKDAKFEEELTCQFKIEIEEFAEFWLEHSKNLKNLHFNVLLLTKVYNVWAKKSTDRLCLMALKIDAKCEGKLTCAFKDYMKNLANFSLQAEK